MELIWLVSVGRVMERDSIRDVRSALGAGSGVVILGAGWRSSLERNDV